VKYRTILADPPWPQPMTGGWKSRQQRARALPYPSMTLEAIKALPVADLAAPDAHLWLWVTNAFLRDGFDVMAAWGFKYLAPVTWVKPSGLGAYFIHRTEHLLFGYRGKCRFPLGRYKPTVLFANRGRHSAKPGESYDLIESISPGPRLELFARQHRLGWDVWGNEVECSVELAS
jgi:N6-adenosine-specific RNA methylase IME4